MSKDPWKKTVEAELKRAEEARLAGNEGQARVCARRAAGGIIRQYLRRKGLESDSMSAYELIQTLREEPDLPPNAGDALSRLVQRVEEGGQLPEEFDLIADARSLFQSLEVDDD